MSLREVEGAVVLEGVSLFPHLSQLNRRRMRQGKVQIR